MALSVKMQLFAKEYLVDFNGAAAYRRAGYVAASNHIATSSAQKLLSNPAIAEIIRKGIEDRAKKIEITAERVLLEQRRVAYADIGDILDFSGDEPKLKPANTIPEDARRAIASFKVKRYREGRGEDSKVVEVTEFKLWPKNDALEKLMKHLGLYEDETTRQIADLKNELAELKADVYGITEENGTGGGQNGTPIDPPSSPENTPEADTIPPVGAD